MTEKTKPGGIVWVCEHGHVDLLHRRSALDLCMTCGDGVCEPRATLGRRSKEQKARDRELAETFPLFAESIRKPRKAPPVATPTEVTVTKTGEGAVTVAAGTFEPPSPSPPFELSKEQRHAILGDGTPPRITFPRQPPPDHPEGTPWPASKGDVVQVSERVVLVVKGLRYLVSEIEIQYEIHDRRLGYAEASRAIKPFDPKAPAFTLHGQERAEGEPQPVSRAQASTMGRRVHEAELEQLERTHKSLGEQLKALASHPRDVRWPLTKSVEAIERRMQEIGVQLGKEPEAEKLSA